MADKFKIVLLGEGRVGKTSLVRRYVLDEFSDNQKSTVQANMYSSKKLHIDDRTVNISIWDTAGQERFRALGPIYYRESHGALVVYDITDADTFEKVKEWVRELRKMVGEDIRICIAGNKADLQSKRQVDEAMVLQYCKDLDAEHVYTSAKTGRGVAECFLRLTKAMIVTRSGGKPGKSGRDQRPSAGARPNTHNVVTIADDDENDTTRVMRKNPKAKEKSGCCKG